MTIRRRLQRLERAAPVRPSIAKSPTVSAEESADAIRSILQRYGVPDPFPYLQGAEFLEHFGGWRSGDPLRVGNVVTQ
jgi:hypothetical protein